MERLGEREEGWGEGRREAKGAGGEGSARKVEAKGEAKEGDGRRQSEVIGDA